MRSRRVDSGFVATTKLLDSTDGINMREHIAAIRGISVLRSGKIYSSTPGLRGTV